ncbi:rab-GTPase-TBC domain-containing protein [Gilbertella persicaria]|uniref:rab-GTPase-TBC domain-containing protein n=1 Tax=Gilbertella persicaria TaxID=101096 RepID=UPI00221E69B6|nr:rab-GTPase-TBC domain-containing protein [Gilbertella persicaria]KAI8062301.1 rab-GTPase-TBC domain-containing protein [Gilbertella persicaria]
MMDTTRTPVWISLANAQQQQQQQDTLTTHSSETDFSQITSSSIHTVQKSCSSLSLSKPLVLQYEQRPEKLPDIAQEMEKWYAMTDRYGFLAEDASKSIAISKEKEVERSEKWADMATRVRIHDETLYGFIPSYKFKKRVYKGIPDCWRRDAWYYLVTDCLKKAKDDDQLKRTYQQLLQKENTHERQIDLDIPRTLRDHIMFKQRYGSGQRALFNVLRAFANYDEEVGYCQGMTNIVATILMYCEEEKAFSILVHMFIRDSLHHLYIPGFPALLESFFIQDTLLQQYIPKLYHHLTQLGLSSDIYATRWYITLFAGGVIQYHTLIRIWDVYFLCGYDIFFFVAVALLKIYEARLLALDLDVCMETLSSTMSVPDDDRFMRHIEKLYEKNQRYGTVQRLRKAYQSKQTFS